MFRGNEKVHSGLVRLHNQLVVMESKKESTSMNEVKFERQHK